MEIGVVFDSPLDKCKEIGGNTYNTKVEDMDGVDGWELKMNDDGLPALCKEVATAPATATGSDSVTNAVYNAYIAECVNGRPPIKP